MDISLVEIQIFKTIIFFLGKEGSRLRQLEKEYLCRIYMPGRDEKSDIIRIVGPNEYIGDAARRIKDIGDEMVVFLYL